MAEEGSDGQEKTEDPSQRRINKALEDGKVLKSSEVNIFTSLFAGLLLMFAIPSFVNQALASWKTFFYFDQGADLTHLAFGNLLVVSKLLIMIGLLIGVPLAIVAIFTQRAVSGQFNFAPKALSFKGKK
jgi:flagellar biosynthetic protein FlhB